MRQREVASFVEARGEPGNEANGKCMGSPTG